MIPAKIQEIKDRFEKIGISALYGGGSGKRGKGHGFWLARGVSQPPGQTISLSNDGKRSGNKWFWMWKDARALLEKLEGLEGLEGPWQGTPSGSEGSGEQQATMRRVYRQPDLFAN